MRTRRLAMALLYCCALAACRGEDDLEVRTFALQRLSPEAALKLIEPYVFADRGESPGALSVTEGAVTVRERPENLERIEGLLEEHDREGVGVTLEFHILEASDSATGAEVPEEIARALRPVLRYPGYRLVTGSILQGTAGEVVSQVVGDRERTYQIYGEIGDVRSADAEGAGSVRMKVALAQREPDMDLLTASVNVPDGQTVVLGSARPYGGERAILLVVRPVVERPPS